MRTKKAQGQRLDVLVAEAAQEHKASGGSYDKRVTTIKAAGTEAPAEGAIARSEGHRPTDEQLSRINKFTSTPKSADDLFVFTTLSANDLVDRDDDQFPTETIAEFAALEQPFSSVGKSYMTSHDYTNLPVGRIFGVDTSKESGVNFLTNEVYTPNTDAMKSFNDNIEFGINWAVSVGVTLGAFECGLPWCGAQMYKSRFFGDFCMEGHDKSAYYVKDGEMDDWGYPRPADPSDPGAVKCIGLMKGAQDFYELSQVFLGAQYFAAIDKSKDASKIIKAAKSAGGHFLGLGAADLGTLKLPETADDKVRHALRHFAPKVLDEDGSLMWTDDAHLRWTFDKDAGVMCLGKTAEDGDDDGGSREVPGDDQSLGSPEVVDGADAADAAADDGGGEEPGDGGSGSGLEQEGVGGSREVAVTVRSAAVRATLAAVRAAADDNDDATSALADGVESVVDDAEAAATAGNDDEAHDLMDAAEESAGQLAQSTGVEASASGNTNEEDDVSKKAVLAAATKARVPAAVMSKVAAAPGNGLDVLIRSLSDSNSDQDTQIKALTPKAALGDQFISSKRAEAIDWYVKANQDVSGAEGTKGVSTTAFEKLLAAVGDDVELIEQLGEQHKAVAQAKFPKSVRRSSVTTDPNEKSAQGDESGDNEGRPDRVSKLHS